MQLEDSVLIRRTLRRNKDMLELKEHKVPVLFCCFIFLASVCFGW